MSNTIDNNLQRICQKHLVNLVIRFLFPIQHVGVTSDLITFLRNHCRDRVLQVECNGFEKYGFVLTSGVLKGPVLGPLFFSVTSS